MRVLNLVTTRRPFFRQQVAAVERHGISCTTVTVPGAYDPSDGRSVGDYVRFVGQVLRKSLGDFDLVHANYGLTAPAAIAQPRRPIVLSVWGSDVHGAYGWLTRRCAPRFDAVVAMSEDLAAQVGVDCHVIPHGIDLETFAPRPATEARAELGWSAEARHVLFPYDPARDVKDFPRAARVVERARESFADPVELHPVCNVPHEQIPTYMNAADALLLTSKAEGLPNAVKEAMACNLPVVATDVGAVADLLGDTAHSGTYERDADLATALVDVLRARERSDGREKVQPLSLDRTGAKLAAVYREVTGQAVEESARERTSPEVPIA